MIGRPRTIRDPLRVAILAAFALPAFAQERPNIVFIMADDMGWGDVGAYNPQSLIPTPNMDRLAGEGVRFTDAHSPSAVCTPTRYGVLTGRYCWRTWLKNGVVGGYTPPLIEPGRPTVASFLGGQGYRTACIGKWHLGLGWTRRNGSVGTWENAQEQFRGSWQDGDPTRGLDVDFAKPVQGGPRALGFDYAYFTAACSTIDGPFCFIENERTVGIPDRPIEVDKSLDADLRPRPGWIAPGFSLEEVDLRFTEKAIEFLGDSRAAHPDQPVFLYLALSAPHAPWLPPESVQGATREGPRGDLVALVDHCVGRVLEALERLEIADETLVIVTSDNGPRIGAEGHRSAGPWRGHKSHIWEGGHRIPFIARWPGHIAAQRTCAEAIQLNDLMATCAGILDVGLPRGAGPDSRDISAALLGTERERPAREAIVSHSVYGVFAIRQGPWKLIHESQTSGGWVQPSGKRPVPGSPGQLYELAEDPGEQNDLFASRPEVVARLSAALAEIVQREEGERPEPLFNGSDLSGWVREGSADFAIHDGVLGGRGDGTDSAWLRSEEEFENFVLRLEYRVEDGGAAGILLHAPRRGNAARIGREIPLQPEGKEWNTLEIAMNWPRLGVVQNGVPVQALDLRASEDRSRKLRSGHLGFEVEGKGARFRGVEILRLPDLDRPRWRSMLRGEGHAGWRISDSNSARWNVEGRTIIASDGHGYLITEERYRDCEFQTYLRTSHRANGGIFFRWVSLAGNNRGFEIQVEDIPESRDPTGSIYGRVRASTLPHTPGEWTLMQVSIRGRHCRVRLDGVDVVETDRLPVDRAGHIALQMHSGRGWVRFEDPRIKVLDQRGL